MTGSNPERWTPKIGERVGAYQVSNDGITLFFGYGTYVGDEIPPESLDWQSLIASGEIVIDGIKGREEEVFDPRMPVIELDSGGRVYGSECWWRPAHEFPDGILNERPVKRIGIGDYRRTRYELSEN